MACLYAKADSCSAILQLQRALQFYARAHGRIRMYTHTLDAVGAAAFAMQIHVHRAKRNSFLLERTGRFLVPGSNHLAATTPIRIPLDDPELIAVEHARLECRRIQVDDVVGRT